MKSHPFAVRRPAQRLVLGDGIVDHAGRCRRRFLRIGADDAGVLRDIGIVGVVGNAPPRSVCDANPFSRGVPRRRLTLKDRERADRSAADRYRSDGGAITLHFEQQRPIGRGRGRVAVA